jgi:hypothetical protein
LTVKRRYLTQREIDRLMDCARKHGRYGHRDATMILVAYRHGLRASEVCDLQWQQIELSEGRLHVHRVKNGIPSVHPIRGDEMRALRKLRRDYPTDAYVFVSERGGPISPIGFHRFVQRLGEAAEPAHRSKSELGVVDRFPRAFELHAYIWMSSIVASQGCSRGTFPVRLTMGRSATPARCVILFDLDLIMDFPRHPGVWEENEEINRVLSDVFIGRFVHDLRDGNLVLIALCADVFFWIS